MEPASSLIQRLGGLKLVALATGVSTVSVYRWQIPRDRGGTGGMIPHWRISKLLALSDAIGAGLCEADFAPRFMPHSELATIDTSMGALSAPARVIAPEGFAADGGG